MTTLYQPFKAMGQGVVDFTTDAFPIKSTEYGTMITIDTSDGAIYITKAHAMAFFGLVDPPFISPEYKY